MIAVVPRILGTLFYYTPDHQPTTDILPAIAELPEYLNWQDIQQVRELCQTVVYSNKDGLRHDYTVLFEGLGEMPAAPWGAVYRDPENLVIGQSTQAYRAFLARESMAIDTGMNEPEDQFGLMLLALAALLEAEKDEAAAELLEIHLLPWAFRYLELVEKTSLNTSFYPLIAKITRHYINDMQQLLELSPPTVQLYR